MEKIGTIRNKVGIIKNKDGGIIKHRMLFKMILNPIFRKIGFSIVSCFEDDKFIKYQIREYPKYCKVVK